MKWLAVSFNNHALFEVQHVKLKLVSQNPGESVNAYNVRWNLERDLVDELAVADMYPAGSVHGEELESMYILSLAGSFSSRLLDLRTIGGTFKPDCTWRSTDYGFRRWFVSRTADPSKSFSQT